jgi:hypothetical protein
VDPLAEKYPSLNPYNYTANNPLNYIDPNGHYKLDAKLLKNERFLSVLIGLKYFAYNNPRVSKAFGDFNTKVSDFADFNCGPLILPSEGRGGNPGRYPASGGDMKYDSETIVVL